MGLYYNRARYLNVGTGRFWAQDKNEGNNNDPISLHKYLYANSNPINNLDPSGNATLATVTVTVSIQQNLRTQSAAQQSKIGSHIAADAYLAVQGKLVTTVVETSAVQQVLLAYSTDLFVESLGNPIYDQALEQTLKIILKYYPQLQFLYSDAPSKKLELNMFRDGIQQPKKTGTQAHHIVCVKEAPAQPARDVLAKNGIDINFSANGVFVPIAVHNTIHGAQTTYYDIVNMRIIDADLRGGTHEVIRELHKLQEEIIANGFPNPF